MKGNRFFFKIFALITEFIIINISCKFAYFLRFGEYGADVYEDYYISFFIVFILGWIGASLFTNSYDTQKLLGLKDFIRSLFTTLFIHIFIVTIYIVSVKAAYLSRLYLVYTYSSALLSVITFRSVLIIAYRYYNSMTYNIRKIALVGQESTISELFNFFNSKNTTVYHFLENIPEELSISEYKQLVRETIDELKAFCISESVNEIYISLPITSDELIEELSNFADDNFIYFRIVTDFGVLKHRQINVDFFGHIPIISLRQEPLKVMFNRVMKRTFDVAFSIFIVLFVYPIVIPIIALAIKLDSDGPVFFLQPRSGKRGQIFTCYKFRTMRMNGQANTKQATKGDHRVTRVGNFLRRTSLDELPQFINVLKGEMSVVGPRPHMIRQTDEYSQIIDKYLFRHFIMPGITGHAQINGFRGETTDPILMKKRVEYDTWYIENWSFWLDLKIVFLTTLNAFFWQENAY